MKKIILLLIVGFTVSLGYSQVTIKNVSGVTLDVGGEYVLDADDGCAPSGTMNFGPVTLAHNAQTTFFPPAGYKVRRVGGSQPSPGTGLGYEIVNCNPMNGVVVTVCASVGGYSVVWNSCSYAEIHP